MITAAGIAGRFGQDYVLLAFAAATCVALVAAVAGFFAVVRNEVFAGDALGHLAFTGGLAAVAYGADARLGVYLLPVLFAVPLGLLGRGNGNGVEQGRHRDVETGIVFALVLGVGAYFLSVFANGRASSGGPGAVHVLFGSVFGLSRGQVIVTAAVAGGVLVLLAFLSRPLLAGSLDPVVSAARGVPVRLLDVAYLALVAVAVAQAVQVVGALLILGLLAAPAATALRITSRPWRALGLAVCIAVADVWLGLIAAQLWPSVPPSFAIVALAFAGVVAAQVAGALSPQH